MASGNYTYVLTTSEKTLTSVSTQKLNFIGTRMTGVTADVRNKIPKFSTITSATLSTQIKTSYSTSDASWIVRSDENTIIKTLWSQDDAITANYKTFTQDVLSYIESNNADAGLATSIYCVSFQISGGGLRTHNYNGNRIDITFTYPTITVKCNVNNENYGEVVSTTHPLNTPIDIGTATDWGEQTCVIEAVPKAGHKFKRWSDGNTNEKREIILSEGVLDAHSVTLAYTAEFEALPYTITVNAEKNGTVEGGGTYLYGSVATLKAIANTGYKFKQWSDGVTENPRSITVTSNAAYTAIFEIKTYSVTTNSSPAHGGTTSGDGIYNYGTVQTITAIPATGYKFTKWSDGNNNNPRQIAISDDINGVIYTAVFEAIVYEIPVSGENGLVETHGEKTYNTTVAITATPHTGYKFVKWSDGETSPNRFLDLTEDVINNIPSYIAEFEIVDLAQNTVDIVGDISLTDSIITKQVTDFIDNNAVRVGDFAFYNCKSLGFLHIKKVKEVGKNAFDNCTGLPSVEIPLATAGLGEYAFSNCINMNALILPAMSVVALTNSNTLNNTAIALGYGHIYVPRDLLTAYREETNWWGQYADAFRAIEDYPELCSLKLT